jgi:fibronectin-binding autotransporter adhesin
MKPRFFHSALPYLSIVFCLAGISPSATAANYTWDLSTTAGTQSGDGIWNTADANWSTNGTTLSAWLQTNATTPLHTATFAGADGTYAITFGENLAAQSLSFGNSGYTLSATAPQTLVLTNVGSGVISVASAKSATIGSNATINFNSTSNTGQRVTLTGSSILNIAAGGTLTKTGVVVGPSATGSTLGFTGGVGTINVAGSLSYNLTTPGNYGGIVISNGAANDNITLNVNNGGTVSSNSLNNGVTVVSANSGVRAGTLTVNTGGTVSTTSTSSATSGINLANGTDSTGTVNLNGGTISTFQINSNYLNTSTNTLSTGGTSNFNFHGGTLRPIANNAAFMGGLTNAFVKSGGAVIDTNGFNVAIAQQLKTDAISLGGGLTKQGAGTLTLTGANTYTGGTTITAGTINLTGLGSLGTGSVSISLGAALDLNATQTINSAVSGAGNITNIGGGTATFTGDFSSFTGTYTHNTALFSSVFNTSTSTSAGAAYNIASVQGSQQGMIAAGNGDYTLQLGSLSGVANSLFRGGNFATGTTTLAVGGLGTNTTFAGIIANGATKIIAFTKVGSGSLTLSGASTYTGATLVSAGTLNLSGSLGATAVTVASGATLTGTGSIASGGSLTLQNGAIVPVSAGSTALSVGGDLTLEGTVQVPFTGTPSPTPGGMVIPFINYTGILTGSGANLSVTGLETFRNPQLDTATLGQIQLTTDSENLIWSGATATWDINGSSNWNGGTQKFFDGDSVTFDNSGVTKNVVLNDTVIPAEVIFDNSSGNNYTLAGTGAITGTSTLTKIGSGSLTLNSAQLHTGITYVDGGSLVFGIDNALPGGAIRVSGSASTLDLGSDHIATVGLLTLTDGGTLTGSGTSALSSTVNFDLLDGTVALPLAGSSGATKSSAGTVTLQAANTYAGATTILDGTLAFGIENALSGTAVTVNGAGAVLNLGANHNVNLGVVSMLSGSITGSGTTNLSSTSAYDLRGGTVSVPLGGTVALDKTTADTLTLTAANSTYSGGTNIGVNNAGTRIGVIRALANGALGTGTVVIGLGGNDATARLELDNGITLGNPILLAARNTTATGIQNLGGNNILSGTLTITAGGANNLIQSDAGLLTFSAATAVTNNTAAARLVTFQGLGNIAVSGVIENGGAGGSLGVIKNDAGTLTLSGANTYTGNTTVNGGVLVITQDDVLDDASTLTLESASSLNLTHAGTDRVASLVIAGNPQANGVYTFGTGKIQVGDGATPFQTWATSKGLTGAPGFENGPSDDPDQDGVSNLAEFAFNGNPLSGADNGLMQSFITDSSDVGTSSELVFTVAVREGTPAFSGSPAASATHEGIVYSIEGSLDLLGFNSAVSVVDPIATGMPDLSGSDYEYRSFRLDASDGLSTRGFIRAGAAAAP